LAVKNIEKIFVVGTAVTLFASILVIIYLDDTHYTIGKKIENELVDASLTVNTGHISNEKLPEDLLIYEAGEPAIIDFSVTNRDPDNDIDTIEVKIPNSEITDGSYEWYIPGVQKMWNISINDDTIVFKAYRDLTGHIFGGSDYYNVAGNLDDALDHDPQNKTNEGIKVSVGFIAPVTRGIKGGTTGIMVRVGDRINEAKTDMVEVEPFPYPFTVVEPGDSFIAYILDSESCTMQLVYDTQTLFSPSRGSDFDTNQYGMKYTTGTNDEKTIIMVYDLNEEKTIKPIIRAKSTGATGDFTLAFYKFSIMSAGTIEIIESQEEYTDTVPSDPSTLLDLDIDGDGILNNDDPDRDGDGVNNDIDPDPDDPDNYNLPPTDTTATLMTEGDIIEGDNFQLRANSTDPNGDILSYAWSVDTDNSWSEIGESITVSGFKAGTHIFTVTVVDGNEGMDSAQVTVEIKEKEEKPGFPYLLLVIAGIITLIILGVIGFYIIYRRKEEEGEEDNEYTIETPGEEIPQEKPQILTPDQINIEPSSEGELNVNYPDRVPDYQQNEDEIETKIDGNIPQPEIPEQYIGIEQANEDADEEGEWEFTDENCPQCGAVLPDDATTCPSCGLEFDLALQCPHCGTLLEEEHEECPHCGAIFQ